MISSIVLSISFVLAFVTLEVFLLSAMEGAIIHLGLDDQQIFPEINLDEVKRTQGMNITFVTTAKTDEECVELLRLLGVPFKNLPISVAA